MLYILYCQKYIYIDIYKSHTIYTTHRPYIHIHIYLYIWELPKIRGPNTDFKIVGILLQGLLKKGPEVLKRPISGPKPDRIR